jgi:hypothetical protein
MCGGGLLSDETFDGPGGVGPERNIISEFFVANSKTELLNRHRFAITFMIEGDPYEPTRIRRPD